MKIVCKSAALLLIGAILFVCQAEAGNSRLMVPRTGLNTSYVAQEVNGVVYDREYLMHVPVDFDPAKMYPLVFGFHGGNNVGALWPATIRHLVDEGEFIGIYPQGLNRRWNSSGSKGGADDVEFLNMIVKQLRGYSNLDFDRMYAIGYSNGSGLVFKYAMETDHFKAVAGLASQLMRGVEPIKGKKPVATFTINGTHDPVIPIDGGKFRANRDFLSAMDSAKKFAKLFGCDMKPVERKETLGTVYEFKNGKDGVESWFYRIDKGDHGLRQHEDPDFYRKIWAFLKKHGGSSRLMVPQKGINTFHVTQEVGGKSYQREILMEVPSKFDPNKKYPLLFAFHGAGAEGAFWTYYLRPMIDEGEFIAVYPQGLNRVWNLGVENSSADEFEFLELVIKKLHGYSNIDLDRMYAFGFSNGSGLVLQYAMRTDHFRSVAGLASQLLEGSEPIPNKKPISTLIVNGTSDKVIPIEGGDSAVGLRFLSAMDSAKKFAKLSGCDMEPVVRKETLGTVYEFKNGKDGVESWFYKVDGGDHGLRQNEDPDFYRKVWTFLKNH